LNQGEREISKGENRSKHKIEKIKVRQKKRRSTKEEKRTDHILEKKKF